MYRRSDDSDSQRREHTAIAGQSGKLPGEGIISKTARKEADSHTDRKSDTAQFSTHSISAEKGRGFSRRESSTGVGNNTPQKRSDRKRGASANGRTVPFTTVKRSNIRNGNRIPRQDGDSSFSRTIEMRAVHAQTGSIPRTERRPAKPTFKRRVKRAIRRAKRAFFTVLYNVLCAIISHRTAAVAALACLLVLGISVPVAVYAADRSEPSRPDIELVGTTASETEEIIRAEDIEVGAFSLLTEESDPEADKDAADEEAPDDTDNTDNTDVTDETSEDEKDTVSDTAEAPTEPTDTEPDSTPVETEAIEDNTFAVTVYFYNRESVTCMTGPATFGDILASAGIWLLGTDRPQVGLDTYIEESCAIGIDSVEYRAVTESESIPFQVDTYNVQSIPRGTTQVIGNGINGQKDTVYTVEYLNGVEVSRVKEYDYIASYPVNQVNYYGTGGSFTAPDGNVLSYSYVLTCKATYYNIHGTTATGLPTGDNIVAVDPSVIPLGSSLYVMNSTYDMGYRIAADTGGAVKGNFIDIWMDVGSPNYPAFSVQGVGEMTVYVLD